MTVILETLETTIYVGASYNLVRLTTLILLQ
jgi:hypothetical protein